MTASTDNNRKSDLTIEGLKVLIRKAKLEELFEALNNCNDKELLNEDAEFEFVMLSAEWNDKKSTLTTLGKRINYLKAFALRLLGLVDSLNLEKGNRGGSVLPSLCGKKQLQTFIRKAKYKEFLEAVDNLYARGLLDEKAEERLILLSLEWHILRSETRDKTVSEEVLDLQKRAWVKDIVSFTKSLNIEKESRSVKALNAPLTAVGHFTSQASSFTARVPKIRLRVGSTRFAKVGCDRRKIVEQFLSRFSVKQRQEETFQHYFLISPEEKEEPHRIVERAYYEISDLYGDVILFDHTPDSEKSPLAIHPLPECNSKEELPQAINNLKIRLCKSFPVKFNYPSHFHPANVETFWDILKENKIFEEYAYVICVFELHSWNRTAYTLLLLNWLIQEFFKPLPQNAGLKTQFLFFYLLYEPEPGIASLRKDIQETIVGPSKSNTTLLHTPGQIILRDYKNWVKYNVVELCENPDQDGCLPIFKEQLRKEGLEVEETKPPFPIWHAYNEINRILAHLGPE